MKIAHSLYNWLPGTMNWVYNQLKYLPKASSIVLADLVQNEDSFPWPYVYSPRLFSNRYAYRILLAARMMGSQWHPQVHHQAVCDHAPQILHSHFGDRGWFDIAFAEKYKLKHIVTFYGYDISMLPVRRPCWKKRYKELFSRADHFLCEGPYMAQSLAEMGCPPGKITVQRLGVEVNQIPYRQRTLEKEGALKILIAGTFREKKGIPIALEAVGIVRKEYPAIQVTIIGDASRRTAEQREKEKIFRVVEKYGLEKNITLSGYQPHENLIREYYNHHIFLSPSVIAADGDTEGGAPVTIIEAALSGMPVISTNHCDIPHVIQNGVSGILVPERDVPALVDAIKKIIIQPGIIPQMGREGSDFIMKNHSIEKQAARLQGIYEGLL